VQTSSVCLGLVAGLGLLLAPARAQQSPPAAKDQPAAKKDEAKDRAATAQDYAALGRRREVTGTLVQLDGTKQLTLKVETKAEELKDKTGQAKANFDAQARSQALQMQATAQRQYQQLLLVRNPVQRQVQLQQFQARQQAQAAQLAQQLAKARKALYETVTTSVTYELPVQEKVRVATAQPPVRYDAQGKAIRPTRAELQKARDPSLPGYKAAFTDLRPDQVVHVYLARPKKSAAAGAASTGQAPAAKGQGGDAAPEEVPPLEERPAVRGILIVREAPEPEKRQGDAPKQP
jgi:hypothetical protein